MHVQARPQSCMRHAALVESSDTDSPRFPHAYYYYYLYSI